MSSTKLSEGLFYDLRMGTLRKNNIVVQSLQELTDEEIQEALAFFGYGHERQLCDMFGWETAEADFDDFDEEDEKYFEDDPYEREITLTIMTEE